MTIAVDKLNINGPVHIHDLGCPDKFVNTILDEISKATEIIVLSALYMGTGEHEKQIINAIKTALNDSKRPNLKVAFIFDHSRSLRNGSSSVKMFSEVIDHYHPRIQVYLYQLPQIRGHLATFIPYKFRELLGVYHCKFAIFDSNVLLTGANLSCEYFTSRQDRYFLLKPFSAVEHDNTTIMQDTAVFSTGGTAVGAGEQPGMAPFMRAFFDIVKTDCHTLQPGGNVQPPKSLHCMAARKEMRKDLLVLSAQFPSPQSAAEGGAPATAVHPLVQHAALGITQESDTLSSLWSWPNTVLSGSTVSIATPYSNFRVGFLESLLRGAASSRSRVQLTLPTTQAHGFGSATGLLSFLPALHHYALFTPLAHIVSSYAVQDRPNVAVRYFTRSGWTYHSKGLWIFPPRNEDREVGSTAGGSLPTSGDSSSAVVTYLGSSNFGERSWSRDFELGFVLVTHEASLQQLLRREHDRLQQHCGTVVSVGTGKDADTLPAAAEVTAQALPAAVLAQHSPFQRTIINAAARLLKSIL